MTAISTATKKPFKRTAVPRVERIASAVVLVLLAGVAAAVWQAGRHYDPGRYALRIDALKSTATAVEGKASTLQAESAAHAGPGGALAAGPRPAEDEETMGHEANAAPAATKSPAAEPMESAVAGVSPMSPTESYNPDNLYEKIDGRAPAYLGFNCLGLRCRSFAVAAAPDSYIDVFEFAHDTPVNAFGMFALERDPEGKALGFVTDGYASGVGFYFRQGTHYVQVIASDEKPQTLALARALAEERARALPAGDEGLGARRRLPAAGLVADSVAYVKENAQGQAFLKDVFQATYEFEGKKVSFFVMVAKPDEAAAAWASYRAFCERFGKVTVLPPIAGAQLFQAETFGSWKTIYQKDGEMGGTFDADDPGKARAFVENYLGGHLK